MTCSCLQKKRLPRHSRRALNRPKARSLPRSRAQAIRNINKKFAKWKAEQEAAVKNAQEESAKLAKMNADQKHQYEMEKLQKENAELKRSALRMELGKTATGLLKEHNVDATQDILDFVVGEDAEETKERIDRFVSIVQAQLKRAEVERATGRTPKTVHNTGNAMSEIDKRIAKYQ